MKKKIKKPLTEKGKFLLTEVKEENNPDLEPPKFSFQFLQRDYCISNCTHEEKVSFVNTLRILGQTAWRELRQKDRHKNGYEKINRPAIRAPIPSHITEDINIIAFRFCDRAPMVGYRDHVGIFHIIWVDRDFTLYPHS